MATALAQEQQWAQQNQMQAQAQRMAAMIPLVLGAAGNAQATETEQEQAQVGAQQQAQLQELALTQEEEAAYASPVGRQQLAKTIKEFRRRMKALKEDIDAEISGGPSPLASYIETTFDGISDVAKVGTAGLSNVITYPIMIVVALFKIWSYAHTRYSPDRASARIQKLGARAMQRLIIRALAGWLPLASVIGWWERRQKRLHDEALTKLREQCDTEERFMKDAQRGTNPLPLRYQWTARIFTNFLRMEKEFDAL